MRNIFLSLFCGGALLLAAGAAAKVPSYVGFYRAAEGPDAAGELELRADGRFAYAFATGALDERSSGRWVRDGSSACLYTDPKPVAPVFSRAGTDGQDATLQVTWPNGRAIASVDFTIAFDTGDPVSGYTQEDGWTLPDDERRLPRSVVLTVPMFGLASPRFELGVADHGRLHVVLTPNDLGLVDFERACLERVNGQEILHRREGDMRFVRARR